MPAHVFRKAESAFIKWLDEHPDGFVLNTTAKPSATYFVLHRAHCTTLHRDVPTGGYTERDYIKACTSDPTPNSLEIWARQAGGPGFTKFCAVCSPVVPAFGDIDTIDAFDWQVAAARSLTSAERAAHAPSKSTPPAFYVTTTLAFARSPYVAAEVLERAAGHCEVCGNPAPFIRASDDTAYLEVHHKVRLADGGYDTVENAIAVCPNCHRRAHFGKVDSVPGPTSK